MTTREESLVLMEWLRRFAALGSICREDAGGQFGHPPEACPQEVAEYLAWERVMRSGGPIASHAYHQIRDAAKAWYREVEGSPYDTVLSERARGGEWAIDQELIDDELGELLSDLGVPLAMLSIEEGLMTESD